MALTHNFMALGIIKPTPGSPLGIFANFPALGSEIDYANMVLFQAHHDNAGVAFVGNDLLNSVTGAGLYYILAGACDSFSVGTTGALNIFALRSLRVDVEVPGDGVIVSVFVR